MASYSRKQLAELLSLDYSDKNDRAKITMWIKRGNILLNKHDLIDDDEPQNKLWIERQLLTKKSPKNESKPLQVEEKVINKTPAEVKKKKKNKDEASGDFYELSIIQKELDIEESQEKIELLRKRNMKMDGESIPTEVVKNVFSYYGKNIVTSFHNTAENWLTKISKIKGLSNSELAEMRGELARGINEAVDKAQIESKRAIANIIKEYSLKREVGEHD